MYNLIRPPNEEVAIMKKPEYNFVYKKEHIEVYLDGEFILSADSMKEAEEELELMIE